MWFILLLLVSIISGTFSFEVIQGNYSNVTKRRRLAFDGAIYQTNIKRDPYKSVMLLTFCSARGCAGGVGTIIHSDEASVYLSTCAHNVFDDYPRERIHKSSFRAYSISDASKHFDYDLQGTTRHAKATVYPYLENPDWVWAPDHEVTESHVGDYAIIKFKKTRPYRQINEGDWLAVVNSHAQLQEIVTAIIPPRTERDTHPGKMVTWNIHLIKPRENLQQIQLGVTWTPSLLHNIVQSNDRLPFAIQDAFKYREDTPNCLQGIKGMSGSPLFAVTDEGEITSSQIGIYVGKSNPKYCDATTKSRYVGITERIKRIMNRIIAGPRGFTCDSMSDNICYVPKPAGRIAITKGVKRGSLTKTKPSAAGRSRKKKSHTRTYSTAKVGYQNFYDKNEEDEEEESNEYYRSYTSNAQTQYENIADSDLDHLEHNYGLLLADFQYDVAIEKAKIAKDKRLLTLEKNNVLKAKNEVNNARHDKGLMHIQGYKF